MLRCGIFQLPLSRPLLMGIVNLTPDSFSGDGLASNIGEAVAQARRQIDAGADLLDLGAESSRPGATPTAENEELRRLLPVLEALSDCGVPISVDTYKPTVMRAALANGASMINDIYALRKPGAMAVVADSNCAVCLMHMQGTPLTMQEQPAYGDIVAEVQGFLRTRVSAALAAGITRDRLLLDPGFGFGKLPEHNFALVRSLGELCATGHPVLLGVSRKSSLGGLTGRPVEDREPESLAAGLIGALKGASVLRVHEAGWMKRALRVAQSLW